MPDDPGPANAQSASASLRRPDTSPARGGTNGDVRPS